MRSQFPPQKHLHEPMESLMGDSAFIGNTWTPVCLDGRVCLCRYREITQKKTNTINSGYPRKKGSAICREGTEHGARQGNHEIKSMTLTSFLGSLRSPSHSSPACTHICRWCPHHGCPLDNAAEANWHLE